jgi:hypothetical protein
MGKKKMKKFGVLVLIIVFGVFMAGTAWSASIFDTSSISAGYPVAHNSSPFNWNSTHEYQTYQIWLSDDALVGHTGYVSNIRHIPTYDNTFQLTADMDVYISTTSVEGPSLSTNFAANHGLNKTQIFSGDAIIPVHGSVLDIDVSDMFYYDGTGNLLIEYVIRSSNLSVFEYYYTNGNGYRNYEVYTPGSGSRSYTRDKAPLWTFVTFGDTAEVPIPGAVWLLGSGLLGLISFRRRIK